MAAELTLPNPPLVESEWITRDSPSSVGDTESSGVADVTTAPIGGSSADVPVGESPPAEFTTAESDDSGWSTTWWVVAVGLVLGGVGALAIATEGRRRTPRH